MKGTCMESRKTLQQTDSHKRAVFFYAKSKLIFIQKGGKLLAENIKKQNMDSLKTGNLELKKGICC